jgi:hypothetical protein
VPIVLKSGSLNLLETSRLGTTCYGIALHLNEIPSFTKFHTNIKNKFENEISINVASVTACKLAATLAVFIIGLYRNFCGASSKIR